MISLKELAKECNVSVATASKALRDYPDIGSKTRDYIKQRAKELGYYPNNHASALKNNKSRTISLLYGDLLRAGQTGYNLTGDYFSHVFESFRDEADLQSYGIILSGFYAWDKRRSGMMSDPDKGRGVVSVGLRTGNSEKLQPMSQAQLLKAANRMPKRQTPRRMSCMEYCKYRAVDGVVLAGVDFESDEIQELLGSDIPVLTLDYISPMHSGVSCDLGSGMETLVKYIYSMGHRSYVYLYTRAESGAQDKLEAFEQSMRAHGIDQTAFACIPMDRQGGAKTQEALIGRLRKVIAEITDENGKYIDNGRYPCIICSDDLLAVYVYQILFDRGLQPGKDISLAGYGGNKRLQAIVPDLTTLEQDTAYIGRLMASRLIEEIEYPATALKEHTIVRGTLRKGKTVAAVK